MPLFSLETRHPLAEFDIIGLTLPYEQLYTNVLTLLDLAGIPLRSADRTAIDPLILAGGSAMINPEPMWAFLDACFIGEGEEGIHDIVDCQAQWREEGKPGGRTELLRRLARIDGVYIPSFYESRYHADGTLAGTTPKPEFQDVAPAQVMKRIVTVMPPPVTDFIVPYIDIVHNRAAIEIQRGCTRGCRFLPGRDDLPPGARASGGGGDGGGGQDDGRRPASRKSPSSPSHSSDYSYIDELVKRGDGHLRGQKTVHRPALPAHRVLFGGFDGAIGERAAVVPASPLRRRRPATACAT